MGYAQPALRRHLAAAAKVALSALLLGIILANLDFPLFYSHWGKLSSAVVATLLAVVAIQTSIIAGLRLRLVLECLGTRLPLARTARIELCGFFFEQIAFGFIGGDAMRLWLLHRSSVVLSNAFAALVIDRCLGLAALSLLVACGLPALAQLFPQIGAGNLIVLAGAAGLLVSGMLVLRFMPERYRRHPVLLEMGRVLALSLKDSYVRKRLLLTAACAAVTHLLNILIIFMIANNLGLPISFDQWFVIVPAALFFSMIPVSAGGWGLREGIFVVGLGTLGVRPEEAVTVSIVFGLAALVVTLPGALVWLSNRK